MAVVDLEQNFPNPTAHMCILTLSQLAFPRGLPITLKYYMYIERFRNKFMPYYHVANVLAITKARMINEMHCAYGTLTTNAVKIRQQCPFRAWQRAPLCSMSPVDLNRGCSSSNILVFFKSNLVAS
jgi:hypothetical protein